MASERGWDPGWVLLRKDTLEGIARGEIDVAFRWWTKPTVKAGGFLQTAVGRLAIVALEPIRVADVTVADAKRAGFAGGGTRTPDTRIMIPLL